MNTNQTHTKAEHAKHSLFTDSIKLGKKGQITIPKFIRDEDGLKEDDVFVVTHTPGGSIILRKRMLESPEDRMLRILDSVPHFDSKTAWEEVKKERAEDE